MALRILLVLAALAAAAWLGLAPSGAFEGAGITRDVGSEVVADSSSYLAVSTQQCTVSSTLGGTCSFGSVTNKGTTALTIRLNKTSDPGGTPYVSSWRIGSASMASTNPSSTPSEIAVGGAAQSIDGTIRICVSCAGQSFTIIWSVEGDKANSLNSLQTGISTTLRYV